MPSPRDALFDALEVGLTLWTAGGTAFVEANAAACRLVEHPERLFDDPRIAKAAHDAALLGVPVPVTGLAGRGNTDLTATAHPLGQGQIGIVLVEQSGRGIAAEPDALIEIDPLTGLPGRHRFATMIDEQLAVPGDPVAALLLDIDRLQEVNDTLGHDQGDALLRMSADRLQRLTAFEGDPCRMGSDEFGLVARLPTDEHPEGLAARVADAFASPFALGRLSIRSTVSVGIAVAPQHGTDSASLLRSADVALSIAKTNGRSISVYRPDRDRFNVRRLRLLSSLREAIVDGRLRLHYQPKIDLETGRVAGAEALARWTDAELGEVPPGEFVPLAEDRGLIGPLSSWVLAESGRQCSAWWDAGLAINVSANISARNLYDPGLVRWLTRLFDNGLGPGQLTLELTETQVAEDLPMARQILRRLQAMGAKLSIDDFGTGYSSLSYLSKLPLDELKIDRSFVVDLDDSDQGTAVVQTIIGLGHDLGLRVVAEGVESAGAVATLTSMGCDQVQGHQFSPALAADEFETWVVDYYREDAEPVVPA